MPGPKYPSLRAADLAGSRDLRRFVAGRRGGDREKIGPERPISTLKRPFLSAGGGLHHRRRLDFSANAAEGWPPKRKTARPYRSSWISIIRLRSTGLFRFDLSDL